VSPVQASAHQEQEMANEPLQFLLTSAATDFHAQHPSHAMDFRNVQIGYVLTPEGAKQYMLCGQFRPRIKDKADWAPFVTIKTSGYEQWVGGQATSFCQRPSITWSKGEWSSSLQSRFDSLQ
jgi:hypothetical protein